MKSLETINLKRNILREHLIALNGISLKQRSEFLFPLEPNGTMVPVVACNFKEDFWEHIMVSLDFIQPQRSASYEEMAEIKDIFWKKNELVMQVHPAKSDYINIYKYSLHLWRCNTIPENAEQNLIQKVKAMYQIARKYYRGKKEDFLLSGYGPKVVVIFGGNTWPTWEEVCLIKQKHWQAEEAAIQFNISYDYDINQEHMIILWDASNFDLPDKSLWFICENVLKMSNLFQFPY